MLAKEKSSAPRLALSYTNPVFEISKSTLQPAISQVPAVPAMPEALLLLQVLLSGPVANLGSVAEAIRADVGLTIGFFRYVSWQNKHKTRICTGNIAESIVLAGIPKLRLWAAQTEILASHKNGRESQRACEQFWAHARLTGLMAEEAALKHGNVDPEQAYTAGLLFRVGELPLLLDWAIPQFPGCDTRALGTILAKQWSFPDEFIDVVQADEIQCSPESKQLLRLVTAADRQALQIQGLVAKYARSFL